jgi:hypothetical protein
MLIFIKVITFYIGNGIKLYNYLLIEIAIIIIVFAHTKDVFLDIIIIETRKQAKQKGRKKGKQHGKNHS